MIKFIHLNFDYLNEKLKVLRVINELLLYELTRLHELLVPHQVHINGVLLYLK